MELVPITRANWRASLELRVQPERLPWVSSREPVALMLLAKSYVRPDGQVWHPLLAVVDGRNVGLLGIGIDERDAQTAWLHHVLVDEREQGRGHGRALMVEAARWLRAQHPTVRTLGLCVLPDNAIAAGLYASLGFETVGVTVDDQQILLARVSDLLPAG